MLDCKPKFNPETDIPSLTGKVILVTGGNNGLGAESILQLAKHHPTQIFLGARSQAKADAAIAKVKETVPDANITFLQLDLASFKSVKTAADTFNAASQRLDVLMNNAGVMALPAGTTVEGYEIQFGTNHMGHALLTKLLLPTLQRTAKEPGADVRIVNLSSLGHNLTVTGGIGFDQLKTSMEANSTWTRYGESKLANVLFTKELARRYPEIKSMTLHPGGVDTGLSTTFVGENHPVVHYLKKYFIDPFFLTKVSDGALTQLWCATNKEAVSGQYYVPVAKPDKGSAFAQDPVLAAKLWDWTETELASHGY